EVSPVNLCDRHGNMRLTLGPGGSINIGQAKWYAHARCRNASRSLPRRSVGAPRKPSFVCRYSPAGLIDERKVLLLVRQCILRVAWTVCRRCVVDDEGERKVLLLERQRILRGARAPRRRGIVE